MEMLAALENSHIIFGEIFKLMEMILAVATKAEADELAEEARLHLWAIENCFFPIYRYYSQQGTILCDVRDQLNEERYEYVVPRKRRIEGINFFKLCEGGVESYL